MINKFTYLIFLLAVIGLQSCGGGGNSGSNINGGGNADGDTASLFVAFESKYQGEWLRSDLSGATTSNMCDEDYDADGTGNTGSQEARLFIFSSGIEYFWRVFVDSDNCSYSADIIFGDEIALHEIELVAETENSVTISAEIAELKRRAGTALGATALNGYNSSLGACGKTDWVWGSFDVDEFISGCGVLVGEDGMDDYKFSGQSIGDVIYWRVTYLDANNLSVETSTDNITFDSADTYKK